MVRNGASSKRTLRDWSVVVPLKIRMRSGPGWDGMDGEGDLSLDEGGAKARVIWMVASGIDKRITRGKRRVVLVGKSSD